MENKKNITNLINLLSTLRIIAQVYEESSILKIKKIRTSVINTRDFLAKLSEVYYNVKTSNRKEIAELTSLTSRKNGKSLIVLLSANTKLYGDIVQNVFHLFQETITHNQSADVMIVGRLGEQMLKEREIQRQHLYFEIPDADLRPEDLKPIIYHVLNYEKVIVFYGKFQNIVTQHPTVSNITGQALFEEGNMPKNIEELKFFFEPSLEKILGFFETQIFTTLFKQTVHESELARYASRVVAMEEALQNIKHTEKSLVHQRRKIQKRINHKKQAERIAGISLWRV